MKKELCDMHQSYLSPPAENTRVYIVLVNWNGWRDTIECLESLLRLRDQNFRIIVCDNGSTDGSVKHISAWSKGEYNVDTSTLPWKSLPTGRIHTPTLKLLDAKDTYCVDDNLISVVSINSNLGFAAANNVGINIALKDSETSHVWLLNTDTVVDPLVLKYLRARGAEDKRIGIVGSTLVYYHDANTIQGVGVKYNALLGKALVLGKGLSKDKLPSRHYVDGNIDYIIGASMFITKEFLQKVGLMSEKYFLFFEELDWSSRNLARFTQVWAPMAIVYHKEGGSIGTSTYSRPSDLAIYFLAVSFFRYIYTYHKRYIGFSLARMLLVSIKFLFHRDIRGFSLVWSAMYDFIEGVAPKDAKIWREVAQIHNRAPQEPSPFNPLRACIENGERWHRRWGS